MEPASQETLFYTLWGLLVMQFIGFTMMAHIVWRLHKAWARTVGPQQQPEMDSLSSPEGPNTSPH